MLIPLFFTAFLVLWTPLVPHHGCNWAAWPGAFTFPAALLTHIYLVFAYAPKWPLVGYAVAHLLILASILLPCLLLISHTDGLFC